MRKLLDYSLMTLFSRALMENVMESVLDCYLCRVMLYASHLCYPLVVTCYFLICLIIKLLLYDTTNGPQITFRYS